MTDALSGITSYTYDLAGNVATLETPGESVTSYAYDTIGRLISETDALGKTEYYRYDATGNVTGLKDRNLNVITTAYDAVNRPVSKAGGGLNVSYSYDAFDNLTEMVDATGTTEFSYTYDNLLESITYPDEKTLFYSYSPEDNTVTKENYREEESVSHFDSLGREVAIYENEDAIAEFVYNGGTIERAIYENGSTDYSYDNAMRLTGLTSSLTGATGNIGEYSYEYDNRGNQTKKTEIKNGESLVTEYTYDALSRLSSVTEPDGSVTSYSFDANGNISAKSITHLETFVFTSGDISVSGITSHTVTYAYDANNRLLTETETVEGDAEFTGTKAYTYDDAGNLIGKTTGGDYGAKAESYVYDALGRMTEYKVGGETVATYGYNGNGERVSKTVGESLSKFYLENGNVINEGNGTAINVTNYFGATGIFKRTSGDSESILYKNGHGDVVRKTSGTSVIRDYDYDAYGKEKTNVTDDNPFRYAGEYADEETGLIYLRARYYDSSIGRFTAEDPIKDGMNWYVYCGNNPVKYVDPWGLAVTEEDKNNLSNSEIEQLEQYTNDWNNAYMNNDQLGMDAAHAKAEMLRDTYRGGGTLTINAAERHAWLTYVTSQGESFTLGTWGSKGDANKRLLINLEKNYLAENPNCYGPYTYKTVAIDEEETRALLKYAVKMEKNNSWTLGDNCAYFAAKAWEKAGQEELNYCTKGGYADPAILYYGISNAYRQYGKFGDGTIKAGQTAKYGAAQSSLGHLTKPIANSIYDSYLDGE